MVQVLFLCGMSSLMVEASGAGPLGGKEVVVLQSPDPGIISYIPSSRDRLLLLLIMHAK